MIRRDSIAAVPAAVVAALAASLVLVGAAFAGTQEDARVERGLERLTTKVEGGPPGASVIVLRGDRKQFFTSGVANVETAKPFTPNKKMRIASTSKAFSGAVALSLVDQGELSLDDTIGERLPGLAPKWDAVTLRQVLNHTGGLPNFTTDPGFQAYFGAHLTERGITIPELVDFVADKDLRYPPGTEYEYSNTDNLVVALFAEQATGKTYEELLRELVFEPLGLERTWLPGGTRLPGPRIEGYDTLPEVENITSCCSMAFVSASGGLYSTPFELAEFMRAYAGGQMFGPAVRREQRTTFAGGGSEPPGPGAQSAGLAVFKYETRCGTVFGHTGNFPGYTQFAATNRRGTKSVAVSANRQLAPDAPGIKAPEAFVHLQKLFEDAVCAMRS